MCKYFYVLLQNDKRINIDTKAEFGRSLAKKIKKWRYI